MKFGPLESGRLAARRVKVDGERFLVLEDSSGAAVGSIGNRRAPESARRRPRIDGSLLAALGDTWFIPSVRALGQTRMPVRDAAGRDVATVDRVSSTIRAIHLPSGTVTWTRHALRPQYRLDGGYAANRTLAHTLVPGFSRRPFTVEVTPDLAARPDGTLVLLLAAWCTYRAINTKVATDGH